MAPRAEAFKRIRQRLRRSLHYGNLRMNCLTMQLSEMVVDYFDRHSPYDYLDMDFAASVSRESCLDPCTLVAAMIYVERLRTRKPTTFIQNNPNEMYLSALVLATKFLNDPCLDEFIWNDEWAEIACLNQARVNQLELRMLDDLQWDLMISDEQFHRAIDSMECWIAHRSTKQQGFLSYSDATVLLTPCMGHVLAQIQRFIAMSAAITSAYLMLWAVSVGVFIGIQKAVEQKNVAVKMNMNTNNSLDNLLISFESNEVFLTEDEECEEEEHLLVLLDSDILSKSVGDKSGHECFYPDEPSHSLYPRSLNTRHLGEEIEFYGEVPWIDKLLGGSDKERWAPGISDKEGWLHSTDKNGRLSGIERKTWPHDNIDKDDLWLHSDKNVWVPSASDKITWHHNQPPPNTSNKSCFNHQTQKLAQKLLFLY